MGGSYRRSFSFISKQETSESVWFCALPEAEVSFVCSTLDMCNTLHLNLTVHEDKIEEGAKQILNSIRPAWSLQDVTFKVFTDGITNKLVGCFNGMLPEDGILVRVYGQNTDLLIDRKAETKNFKLLQKAGYAPELYATFNNGLAYKFIPGEILTVETVRSPCVYPLVARMVAKLHLLDYGNSVERKPALWDKISQFISLIPDQYSPPDKHDRYLAIVPGGAEKLWKELSFLNAELSGLKSPVVFCHNDLLLGNVIHTPGHVTFIDYEYACYNYQAYDIGNHFAEFPGVVDVDYSRYPEKELQWDWLRVYLEEYNSDKETEVTDEDIEELYNQVNKFAVCAHFLWGVWALLQAYHSSIDFDFMEYANIRLSEYFAKKAVITSSR